MAIEDSILDNEPTIRLAAFSAIFVAMALWELWAPRRSPAAAGISKALRWGNHIAIAAFNSAFVGLCVRLVVPAAAAGIAAEAADRGWGLLHVLAVPRPWNIVIAIVVLDALIWLQHRIFHAVPFLWRIHRMHHADPAFDTSTAIRFHPLEILLSLAIKIAAIVALGAPAIAVVVFEILLNATAMFNHGNVHIPARFDRILRWFIVTPDMHRVHHSIHSRECHSNFGFNLSIWDRLGGSYRHAPSEPHETMAIGLAGFANRRLTSWLPGMLLIPFMQPTQSDNADRSADDHRGQEQ